MILVWHLYWPLFAAALVIGVLAGRIGLFLPKVSDDAPAERKQVAAQAYAAKRKKALLAGVGAVLAAVALWHWPIGAAGRFAGTVERLARGEIRWVEMPEITVEAARSPLRRELILSGPANELQQAEFAKMMEALPGVARARWQGQGTGLRLPLAVEVSLLALTAFLLGLLFSYLVEIRRRVNSEWSW